MLDVFHIAKPQNCDIQIFGETRGTSTSPKQSWVKPRGVSHVYMLLIGSGGNGDNASAGGGSGAVTVWYGAAQNVPDILYIQTGAGGSGQNTTIIGLFSGGFTQLLRASATSNTTGGTATSGASPFEAMGFYQSIAGQNGVATPSTASTTTFLSGGSSSTTNANYGYSATTDGYFQLQPIIVGVGGGGSATGKRAGFGCGGSLNSSTGGPGMVLIASW